MANETVLVGEFSHETNTFAVRETDRKAFADRREYFGASLVENLRGIDTPVEGIVDVAESAELELVPTVAAAVTPGGVVTADAYETYAGEILSTAHEHADDLDGSRSRAGSMTESCPKSVAAKL